MPGLQGILTVAEMRERRIKREEREARAAGRLRVKTPPQKPATPPPKPVEADAFRKRWVCCVGLPCLCTYTHRVTALAPVCRFLLSDAKGRFGGVVKATGRTMPTGLLAQDEPPPPPPPPQHHPRISNAVGALGTGCAARLLRVPALGRVPALCGLLARSFRDASRSKHTRTSTRTRTRRL